MDSELGKYTGSTINKGDGAKLKIPLKMGIKQLNTSSFRPEDSEQDKAIRRNAEYLFHLKHEAYPNKVSDTSNLPIPVQIPYLIIIEIVYLVYSASKRSTVIVIDPSQDVVFRAEEKRTNVLVYYNLSTEYHADKVVGQTIGMIRGVLEQIEKRRAIADSVKNTSSSNKQSIIDRVVNYLQTLHSCNIKDFTSQVQKLHFFENYSDLKRIQNAMHSTSMCLKGPDLIALIKKEKLGIKPKLKPPQIKEKALEIVNIFQKYGVSCAYLSDEPPQSSYNIRMFLYYTQIETINTPQATWNTSRARFLIEISPKERVICIRLLTVRSDKVDYIDQNIFKMNMYSFFGNLVSIEPYKLSTKQQELYKTKSIMQQQTNRFYFAYKSSTDIGLEDENVRKLFIIMDYLVATQRAIEPYFQLSVNETEPHHQQISEVLEHYQEIAMRTLMNIYK